MVLTRAMCRQLQFAKQIAEEYAKAPAKVAALTTPGVVSHIASKLDSAADLGALFRLVNDPCYRYELEPIAVREREKRERRLAEERQRDLITELYNRSIILYTPPLDGRQEVRPNRRYVRALARSPRSHRHYERPNAIRTREFPIEGVLAYRRDGGQSRLRRCPRSSIA